MTDIPKLMTRNFVMDLRSRAKEVTKKLLEVIKMHFDEKIKDSTKGNKILLSWQVSSKKNATADLSVELELQNDKPEKPILSVDGKLKGDKDAVEELRSTCVQKLFKVKKQLDGYLKELNDSMPKEDKASKDEPVGGGEIPRELTDKEWKRCKNLTLTDTGIGEAIRKWQEFDKKLSKTENLNYKTFDEAKVALEQLSGCLKEGKRKANPTLHAGSVRAIEALEKLVATQTSKLEGSLKEYKNTVETWLQARKQDVAQFAVWDRKLREYVGTTAKAALTKMKEASNTKEEEALKVATQLLKDAIEGLDALKEQALKALKETSANYNDKNAPDPKDWTKEVLGIPKVLKQTMDSIIKNHNGATSILKKALGGNK